MSDGGVCRAAPGFAGSAKDLTNLSIEDTKTILLHEITNKRRQKRSTMWNYFQEDSNDFTFVTCYVCRKRLSRGRSDTSLGSLSYGLMKNHLKCHYIELAHYTDGKKPKSVPN